MSTFCTCRFSAWVSNLQGNHNSQSYREYSPKNEIGVHIFDDDLQIELPCPKDEVILSQKDQNLKSLKELKEKIINT